MQKIRKAILFAFAVIAIILIAVFVIFRFKSNQISGQTSGWKTYASSRYGFEIKYPDTATVNEALGDEVDFYNKDLELSIVSWANDNNYKTLDDLIKDESNAQKEGFASVIPSVPKETQKFTLDGTPAIKWYYTNEKYGNIGVSIVVLKNKYFYQIEGKPYSENYISKFTNEEENSFNKMLSTFKFTK